MAKRMYVGIDVSNKTLDVCFVDVQERQVRRSAIFSNDPDGWTALRTAIVSAARLCGKRVRVDCGMESTSNMHKRLEQALRLEKRRKLRVHVLNPMAVKNFRKALLKDVKTDKVDSRCIALFLARMQPEEVTTPPDGLEELKEITRNRRKMVEECTAAKNRAHKMLRYYFPGYQKFLGKQLTARTLRAFSEMPSPDEILARSIDEIAKTKNGPRHRFGVPFANKLHALAEQAPDNVLRKSTRLLLSTTTRRVVELSAHIADLDAVVEEMLDEIYPDQVLTSIPGIGKVSAAAIMAEVGDVIRFKSKTQFVGYCGLYPIVWESGEAKKRYRMTRKGNRMLKTTLLVASAAARQYNPVIAIFYERLRASGKSTKAAGGAIARKMAGIVYALLTSDTPWSEELAAKGLSKAEAMLASKAL